METVKIELKDDTWVDVVLVQRYGVWTVVSDANEHPELPMYWVIHEPTGLSAMLGGVVGFRGVDEAHEWAQALYGLDAHGAVFDNEVWAAWRKFNAGKTVALNAYVTLTYDDMETH
jgi:hypothetical protein